MNKSWLPDARGLLSLGCFILMLLALILLATTKVPAENKDLFTVLISQGVIASFLVVTNFSFGSSDGANKNRDQLNAITTKMTDSVTK